MPIGSLKSKGRCFNFHVSRASPFERANLQLGLNGSSEKAQVSFTVAASGKRRDILSNESDARAALFLQGDTIAFSYVGFLQTWDNPGLFLV